MNTDQKARHKLIELAIGKAVSDLIERGLPVSHENILYELERVKSRSRDLSTKSILQEVAQRLRVGHQSKPT
jgi:hypothetical protein